MTDLTQLSKFLALALRHRPHEFGLNLDEQGFTDLETMQELIAHRFSGKYSAADLAQVVEGDKHGKKRYEIRDGQIRAMFGHNKNVGDIHSMPAVPPEILYHGTTSAVLDIIRQHGLKPQQRLYVHLTPNLKLAGLVAGRHEGDIVVLRVRASEAHQTGIVFYNPEPDHFLSGSIPASFIQFP